MEDEVNKFYGLYDLQEVRKQTGLSSSRITVAKNGMKPSMCYPCGIAPKLIEGVHWILGEKERRDKKGLMKVYLYTEAGIEFLKTHRKGGRKQVMKSISLDQRTEKKLNDLDLSLLNRGLKLFSTKEVQNFFGISKAVLAQYRNGVKRRGRFVLPLLRRGEHWMYHEKKLDGSFIRYSQEGMVVIQNHLASYKYHSKLSTK